MDNIGDNKLTYDYSMQGTQTNQPAKPATTSMMPFQIVYPEVYYKLQPYVSMVCDQMVAFGDKMPSQEMLDQISDGIYEDVCRRDPDFAEYVRREEENPNSNLAVPAARFGFNPIGNGFRFRRRGVFRDLIDILLLSELFGRRRRNYY